MPGIPAKDAPYAKYVVHCKRSRYDVYCGRGGETRGRWGNPFRVGVDGERDEVCEKHAAWLDGKIAAPNGQKPPTRAEIRAYLRGKVLGCWCAPQRCHCLTLARIANE